MRFDGERDPDLERRLRRIAEDPEPPVPASVIDHALTITEERDTRMRAGGTAFRFSAGSFRGIAAVAGVAAALVIGVAGAGLVLSVRQNNVAGDSPAPSALRSNLRTATPSIVGSPSPSASPTPPELACGGQLLKTLPPMPAASTAPASPAPGNWLLDGYAGRYPAGWFVWMQRLTNDQGGSYDFIAFSANPISDAARGGPFSEVAIIVYVGPAAATHLAAAQEFEKTLGTLHREAVQSGIGPLVHITGTSSSDLQGTMPIDEYYQFSKGSTTAEDRFVQVQVASAVSGQPVGSFIAASLTHATSPEHAAPAVDPSRLTWVAPRANFGFQSPYGWHVVWAWPGGFTDNSGTGDTNPSMRYYLDPRPIVVTDDAWSAAAIEIEELTRLDPNSPVTADDALAAERARVANLGACSEELFAGAVDASGNDAEDVRIYHFSTTASAGLLGQSHDEYVVRLRTQDASGQPVFELYRITTPTGAVSADVLWRLALTFGRQPKS